MTSRMRKAAEEQKKSMETETDVNLNESPESGPGPEAKRRSVHRACESCREAHTSCSNTRPCERCVRRRLICVETSHRKRGRPVGARGAGGDRRAVPAAHDAPGAAPVAGARPPSHPIFELHEKRVLPLVNRVVPMLTMLFEGSPVPLTTPGAITDAFHREPLRSVVRQLDEFQMQVWGEDGRYLFMNDATKAAMRLSDTDVFKTNLMSLVPADAHGLFRCHYACAMDADVLGYRTWFRTSFEGAPLLFLSHTAFVSPRHPPWLPQPRRPKCAACPARADQDR